MDNNVILSIKPKYVREIVKNVKKYEYRKQIFKKNVNKVYIYESTPTKSIIGYFLYKGYIQGTPEEVWMKTCDDSGISKEEFDKYFQGKDCAYAIIIEELYLYSQPINPYMVFDNFVAPQSYRYVIGDLQFI